MDKDKLVSGRKMNKRKKNNEAKREGRKTENVKVEIEFGRNQCTIMARLIAVAAHEASPADCVSQCVCGQLLTTQLQDHIFPVLSYCSRSY